MSTEDIPNWTSLIIEGILAGVAIALSIKFYLSGKKQQEINIHIMKKQEEDKKEFEIEQQEIYELYEKKQSLENEIRNVELKLENKHIKYLATRQHDMLERIEPIIQDQSIQLFNERKTKLNDILGLITRTEGELKYISSVNEKVPESFEFFTERSIEDIMENRESLKRIIDDNGHWLGLVTLEIQKLCTSMTNYTGKWKFATTHKLDEESFSANVDTSDLLEELGEVKQKIIKRQKELEEHHSQI